MEGGSYLRGETRGIMLLAALRIRLKKFESGIYRCKGRERESKNYGVKGKPNPICTIKKDAPRTRELGSDHFQREDRIQDDRK